MATVAGRKKSIVSSAGIQIDTPVANNTLLNKSASQSTSLYQQCSQLRSRLMRIRGFDYYFSLISTDARRSTDPVSHLWDLFSLGIPLCFLFDLLPSEQGFPKIGNSQFNEEEFDQNPDKPKKRAIAHFAMQVRTDKISQTIPGCEPFTVTDLWDRNSTDGLVKVVHTVTAIVNHLPEDVFNPNPSLSSSDSFESPEPSGPGVPANAQESARNNIIREIVETERKYVQDLEVMQKYANALAQGSIIDQDTIHHLFPNLNKLLNFQRKFLIRLESIAEQPWQNQRWGQPFLESEEEFVVYEPYCANYTNASDLMLSNEQNLAALNHLINVKGELPAFLIKPIQRVCKYPLLLDSLIKATSTAGYSHFEELKQGSDAAKRITDKINEAQRRAENELTVENLRSRIDDWKGHHLENFGDLLLDDIFVVTKSDIDREYHVFLFEKIILCCKEVLIAPQNGRTKSGKSNSILKKQPAPPPLTLPGGVGQPTKKNTPLLLKGRIFLGNVTQAVPVPSKISTNPAIPTQYPLAVWWKGDDDLEYFTLRCRREDQMRQWEAAINRLIKEAAQRRASERNGMSRLATASSAGYPPRYTSKMSQSSYGSSAPGQTHSMYSVQSSVSTATSSRGPSTPYGMDDQNSYFPGQKTSVYSGGPPGYPPHDGFELEQDEDEYEDYPPSSSASAYAPSGRGTPVAYRRDNAVSMPPERQGVPNPYDHRPRAQTEDTNGPIMQQWRRDIPNTPSPNLGPAPTPQSAYPHGSQPHPYNRMNSTSSAYSYASNESFGNGTGGPRSRPPLRSQFSSTRLRSTYEQNEGPYPPSADQASKGSMPTMLNANGQPIATRARSASSPMAYVPKQAGPPPPVPVPGVPTWSRERSGTTSTKDKRGSGSSQSTGGDSSDYSPNSGSPVTPFGSSESSLAGVGMRAHYSEGSPISKGGNELPVKVKVHFHEDIFVIQVAMSTEYGDLVEKVGKKIRLCGPRRDDGPLRVKYRDEDGDMVTLGSTEDVQMAFEQYRPGGQVTLFVT